MTHTKAQRWIGFEFIVVVVCSLALAVGAWAGTSSVRMQIVFGANFLGILGASYNIWRHGKKLGTTGETAEAC